MQINKPLHPMSVYIMVLQTGIVFVSFLLLYARGAAVYLMELFTVKQSRNNAVSETSSASLLNLISNVYLEYRCC